MNPEHLQAAYAQTIPALRANLTTYLQSLNSPPQVIARLETSLNANTQTGRQTRALAVLQVSAALLAPSPPTPTQLKDLCILAYLVQLQTSYILIADDLVDRSPTRRNAPTWWARPEIGPTAVSDAFVLNFSLYHLLRLHFQSHPRYLDLLHVFLENSLLTEIGQSADHLMATPITPPTTAPEPNSSQPPPSRFANITPQNYDFIITHKAGHFFMLGAAIALTYLDLHTPTNTSQLHRVGVALGRYAQVQDDYLDVFADPRVTGKMGSDIREGKCTWLLVEALQRGDARQRAVLEGAYGVVDHTGEAERRVREVFVELGLEGVYREYERGALGELREVIGGVDEGEGLRRGVFEGMALRNSGSGKERVALCNVVAGVGV